MPETLHLYTDFVCPFCFIAEQSTVPRLLAEFDLTLDWRGFELHPNTPPGGVSLSKLFPGVPLSSLHERTQRFAARFGVSGFTPPDVLQNSRRALAVAELARDRGRLQPFRAAAFEAYWRQQKDLEDDGDLGAIAIAAGLPRDLALGAPRTTALSWSASAKSRPRRAAPMASPAFRPSSSRAKRSSAVIRPRVLDDAAARAGVRRRSRG